MGTGIFLCHPVETLWAVHDQRYLHLPALPLYVSKMKVVLHEGAMHFGLGTKLSEIICKISQEDLRKKT